MMDVLHDILPGIIAGFISGGGAALGAFIAVRIDIAVLKTQATQFEKLIESAHSEAQDAHARLDRLLKLRSGETTR